MQISKSKMNEKSAEILNFAFCSFHFALRVYG